jgi:hypothetical protein
MVQPQDADVYKVTEFYGHPQTQSEAVHFIGKIRNFDKTQNEKFLTEALEIALSMQKKAPFDEVTLDGKITDEASDITLVICLHLSELGFIPDYEK